MNIIIIANGSFPTEEAVLAQLREADHLVCCDGALGKFLNWYRALSHRPLLRVSVVGDGDSLTSTVLEEARHEGLQLCHQLISEQESNDLSKAVRYALADAREETSVHLSIVGATGLREDHTLGNISLLAYYAMEYPQVEFEMVGDYGVFLPFSGERRFKTHRGQQVSLFSLTPDEPVSVSGLRYPIEGRCLRWWWEGTLNEALGDSFEVRGGCGIVYLLTGKK
ncbi:MAG: thiamine diphosphokinase [Bacteroidales bacterium]|nr:thiamine diphosphokinase [Bacteroidales bacterium]